MAHIKRPKTSRKLSQSAAAASCCFSSVAFWMLVGLLLALPGCGGMGSSSSPPPPTNIAVSITPESTSILLGESQPFTANVTGTPNTAVSWGVNGVNGGNASLGTISNSGLYTAPQILPSPTSVTIQATSRAAPTVSASASVTLRSDIVVNISPNSASIMTGSTQSFTASVAGSGNPAMSVTWSVNGVSGGSASLGTVTSTGPTAATYRAPQSPPSPATVSVAATSVADPSRSASASVTITCPAVNSILPPTASVALGWSQTFSASLCAASGISVTWDVNGIVGGNSAIGTITNTGSASAVFTAPLSMPANNEVTVHATAGAQSASASVALVSNVSVSVSPSTTTLSVGQRATFTPTVQGSANQAVSWAVNGIANGNTSVGQICQAASNPCAAPAGPATGSVDYLAPATLPIANPVNVTATSQADPSRSSSAQVTITSSAGSPVAIRVIPRYAFLPPSGATPSTVQFAAVVSGTTNPAVTWSAQSGAAGQGCAGSACGTISTSGLYTAPTTTPSPNIISIIAASQADPTTSAAATVALTGGPVIEKLFPSSATAGAASPFTLAVGGLNFVAGSGAGAATILVNGSPRTTSCPNSAFCTTALNPPDVGAAGSLAIQIQNPGSPGLLSNPVALVIVPPDASQGVIPLSGSQPAATGKDLVVTEPTSAATGPQTNVDFVGLVTAGGTTCNSQGSPLTVTRPASGSTIVSICVHGNNLDPSLTYEFSGPSPGDIGVSATSMAGLFPNLIRLDLTLSSTTLPGVRSLFITTLNGDRGVATGMLEVK